MKGAIHKKYHRHYFDVKMSYNLIGVLNSNYY